MQTHVPEEHPNGASLRSSLRTLVYLPAFEDADNHRRMRRRSRGVFRPVLRKPHHPSVVETAEEVLEIGFQGPTHAFARHKFVQRGQCMMRASARAPGTRTGQKVRS